VAALFAAPGRRSARWQLTRPSTGSVRSSGEG
jgi:hypothetical protein